MQDQPVRLAGDGGDPGHHVFLLHAHRTDEHIESTTLSRNFDAAIDDVHEQKVLLLVLERHLTAAPEDDGDHFLEVAGQRSSSAVGHEAERANGAQHPFAGFGLGTALAVEDA